MQEENGGFANGGFANGGWRMADASTQSL